MKKKQITALATILLSAALLTSCAGDNKVTDGNDSPTTTGSSVEINVGGKTTDDETENAPEETGNDASTEPDETGGVTSDDGDKQTTEPENTTETPSVGGGDDNVGSFTEDDQSITIAGIKLTIGMDFLPHADTIGDHETEEGQACIGGGYDKNYYYGDSLSVYTYAEDGKQIIYDIYITGAEYPTDKGAVVGKSTRDEIAELYGDATESFLSTYNYQIEGSDIIVSFTFSGDVLESIDILDGGVN